MASGSMVRKKPLPVVWSGRGNSQSRLLMTEVLLTSFGSALVGVFGLPYCPDR